MLLGMGNARLVLILIDDGYLCGLLLPVQQIVAE